MFNIQALNSIAAVGLKQFPENLYHVEAEIHDPDAILVRSYNLHDKVLPSSVKVIGRAGAGVNNIPVDLLTKQGIPVLNTPGANANAVKELVIAGMLLASRHICQAWNYLKHLSEKNDTDLNKKIEQDKKQFVGFELLGKTLGVIGLGSIGVKVANTAMHLGMNIIGYDPTITVNRAWELSADVKQAMSLQHLLSTADFVSIHVPLNEQTKKMIGHTQLALMKKNAVLLNFSRENIIDTDALKEALQQQKIFSYITDFPTLELRTLPTVTSLPHLGASTREAEENCALMIAKQVRSFLETGAITHAVNFPSIEIKF